MQTREVTWGERLVLATFHAGGMARAVESIRSLLGPSIGSRATFSKLLHVESPGNLREIEQYRAWLLLVTYGEEPNDWGIPDEVVPTMLDVDRLRDELPRLDSNQQPSGYTFPQVTWAA